MGKKSNKQKNNSNNSNNDSIIKCHIPGEGIYEGQIRGPYDDKSKVQIKEGYGKLLGEHICYCGFWFQDLPHGNKITFHIHNFE